MTGIKIEGLDKLQKHLKKQCTLEDVREVVRMNGSELQKRIQRHAEFKKGYQTGITKRSVGLEITDAGMTAESGPTTEYAEYLEKGTRFMDKQAFVEPALNEQKPIFEAELRRKLK